jgi:hypothetical protein
VCVVAATGAPEPSPKSHAYVSGALPPTAVQPRLTRSGAEPAVGSAVAVGVG